MPDLQFEIEGASAIPFAAVPTMAFKLKVTNARANESIHTVALRCQIQIEASRRRYSSEEQARLMDLFGEPDRWSQTLRTMLWTHANLVIPSFSGATTSIDMPVPCTFDFNVAATKYFEGLTDGDIPLQFQFSGTVFYALADGTLQVAPISWEQEAKFKLPQQEWRTMMDTYYPNSAWLSLRRDVFDRLYKYKMENGIPTWEQALEEMLPVDEPVVAS
jgi:Family of unknown function (DUF6084)